MRWIDRVDHLFSTAGAVSHVRAAGVAEDDPVGGYEMAPLKRRETGV